MPETMNLRETSPAIWGLRRFLFKGIRPVAVSKLLLLLEPPLPMALPHRNPKTVQTCLGPRKGRLSHQPSPALLLNNVEPLLQYQ